MKFEHISVLLNECIEYLNIKPYGIYIDGTLGGGGHSYEILKRLDKRGKLIGIDQDIDAVYAAKERLNSFENVSYVHDNFSNILSISNELNFSKEYADGILLDLGVSSYQLDEAERGFSYMNDAPLDMRMDREKDFSAYDVVNTYSEDELRKLIYEYGEEKWAKRIASFIVEERKGKKIQTTFELVSIIKKAVPKGVRIDGPHPAKRTFQAIRIEVNGELKILERAVKDMISILKKDGRLCIITFHSLEDRIVKNIFKELENPCTCPREFPVCICNKKPSVKIITRKPIIAGNDELSENHRARSAKLRVVQKI